MAKNKPRFPLPRYPRGWFQVEYSDELAPGEVKPIKYFGKDLVLFRSESGKVSVLDAHCPHMGAHLGHGGKVEGENVICPFHSWKFNTEGELTDVPYAKRLPKSEKSKVPCWPVKEVNGMIMVWHDVDKAPPAWDIPELVEYDNSEWTPYLKRRWQIRTHNQEMCENTVDIAHFKYVHGMKIVPQPHTTRIEYPHIDMMTETIMDTPMGEVRGELEVNVHGFGFSTSRFTGIVETTVIASVAPIDDELVDVRFSFAVKKTHGADVARGVGKAFSSEIARQLEEDRPVWEHKKFIERPLLCDGDGPIAKFRKWCREFYPEWYIREAEEAYYGPEHFKAAE